MAGVTLGSQDAREHRSLPNTLHQMKPRPARGRTGTLSLPRGLLQLTQCLAGDQGTCAHEKRMNADGLAKKLENSIKIKTA
jgi:hypothetical protein